MSDAAFVARSRAAFAEHFPQISAGLERGRSVESSIVLENDIPVDIRVEGQLIYGGDARRFAAGQVAAFMKKPLRFLLQRMDLCGMVTAVGWRLIGKIDSWLRTNKPGECSNQPTNNPTFLFVFGVGLGYHLEELARETKARWLIIVEPLADFFEPSFHVVDWAKLVDDFRDRGGSVQIINEADPRSIIRAISAAVLSKGVPYADGSWVFTHYPFWAFTEVRNQLNQAMEFVFVNRGYYEDELIMMRNAVTNYAKHDCWLLENQPRLRRPEVAVIVGAGPSLDESIETIHRIRDRVVLFSAGTALRALLSRGIIPDFHCELENGGFVHDVLKETAKLGDLSQITLIASSTVDVTVPPLFAETIFYFRDSVSPQQVLGRKHYEIYGTGPTCVNTAITTAAVMGFSDFVLFGTDCGTRLGSLRHAKGTIYSDVSKYHAANVPPKNHVMEVPGNFGGTVQTEIVYDSCRVMMGETIRYFGLKVINCSDGALIAGAEPRVPESLEIRNPVVDRAAFRSEIERTMQYYAAGKILEEADLGVVRQQTEQMFSDLDDLLVELGEGEADFGGAFDRMMAFVDQAKDKYGRTESIISGSLQALPRVAMFYGFRIVEPAGRRQLFDVFIAEFRAIAADMAKNIYALFDGLETHVPSALERVIATVA